MKDVIADQLRKAERATVRLRNKQSRADLDYTVQVSISSVDPTVVRWAMQMTPPAEGLAPITVIALTPEDLIEKIKSYTKHIDLEDIEKAYHKAQIEACKRTITGHEERIKELENPKSEDEEPSQDERSE